MPCVYSVAKGLSGGSSPLTGLMDLALLALLGFGVGGLGTILGIGGGFIVVPFLLFFYGFAPGWAAGTSLLVVLINSLSGSLAYLRQRRVDILMALVFTLGSVPGSILGSVSTASMSGGQFRIYYAAMLLAAAIYLIFKSRLRGGEGGILRARQGRRFIDSSGREYVYSFSFSLVLASALFSGFIAGFFGVGGGIVNVPVMVILLGVPAHVATATSHLVLVVTSATGIATHAALGHVNLFIGGFIGLGALFGAQVGARASQRLSGRTLEILFSVMLIVIAVGIVVQQLLG